MSISPVELFPTLASFNYTGSPKNCCQKYIFEL